jgi:hypothetical protein
MVNIYPLVKKCLSISPCLRITQSISCLENPWLKLAALKGGGFPARWFPFVLCPLRPVLKGGSLGAHAAQRGFCFWKTWLSWRETFPLESPYCHESFVGENTYLRKYRFGTLWIECRNVWIHLGHHWVLRNSFSCLSHTVFGPAESNEKEPLMASFFRLEENLNDSRPQTNPLKGTDAARKFLKTWLFKGL